MSFEAVILQIGRENDNPENLRLIDQLDDAEQDQVDRHDVIQDLWIDQNDDSSDD